MTSPLASMTLTPSTASLPTMIADLGEEILLSAGIEQALQKRRADRRVDMFDAAAARIAPGKAVLQG